MVLTQQKVKAVLKKEKARVAQQDVEVQPVYSRRNPIGAVDRKTSGQAIFDNNQSSLAHLQFDLLL